jgi:UDP-N-acetylmuramoyl-tripeptide--D-alanyl-D-alanine ligase
MDIFLNGLVVVVFALESVLRLHKELHICQLNSYFNSRYGRWLKGNYFSADRLPVLGAFSSVLSHWLLGLSWPTVGLWALCYGLAAWRLWSAKQKKKLVLTPRATRLFVAALALTAAAASLAITGGWVIPGLWLISLAMPAVMMLANGLMMPVERSINQGFYRQAQEKLSAMPHLRKIAITGSYGKTSTKFYIQRVLAEKFNALMTPGSYNTTMGVVLTVNRDLKPFHQWFVAEMGAKKLGDVKEICDLVHPQWSVLTAVGPQHLDTFGSIENVCRTKHEIVEALPADGLAFLNGDDPRIRSYSQQFAVRKIYFGIDDPICDYRATDIAYSSRGMSFQVLRNGEAFVSIETKLLGKHDIYNILTAVAVGAEAGVTPQQIRFAVQSLRGAPHRLELRPNPGGVTIIDDAFNSNPVGAANAVDVLCRMEGGKKFIVTPGMIELGAEEKALNKVFGTQIAKAGVDVAILVGPKQTLPIQEGLKEAGFAGKLVVAKNLDEAIRELYALAKPGDVALLENDLPDTFNEG